MTSNTLGGATNNIAPAVTMNDEAVDAYGFLAPRATSVDTPSAPLASKDISTSMSAPWTTEALRDEEGWWASDFLLYLSWRSALGATSRTPVKHDDHHCGSHGSSGASSASATPRSAQSSASPRCSAASPASTIVEIVDAPAAVPRSSSASFSAPLHSLQTVPDTVLMEEWFWGRWNDRLRAYGGCPHMALRGLLWGFFSGAWQQPTAKQMDEAAHYAALAASEGTASDFSPTHGAALESIDRDIGRTFPHHVLFLGPAAASAVGQRQLRRLLRAYAARDPEVGYCQGMAFVAAVVLMVAPEVQAYQIFCALMREGSGEAVTTQRSRRHGMRQLYRSGFPLLQTLLAELESHVRSLLPALAAHLKTTEVHISMFASRWFLTLFVHQLTPPVLLRVWDFFLVRGWSVMVQVAVALLHQEQAALLKLSMEGILLHLKVVRSQRQSEGELLRRVCNAPVL